MKNGRAKHVGMPVQIVADEEALVSPYTRLSAAQVNEHRVCPHQWWLKRVQRLKDPLPPAIVRGNAVEDAVCRVLRESPVWVEEDAPAAVLESPIDGEGLPDRQAHSRWPAPHLSTRPASEWPVDKAGFLAWAVARLEVHLPNSWARAVADFEDDPNTIGEIEDLDIEEARAMAVKGIEMHLDEVERCLAADGGPHLSDWRRGAGRSEWPAPDGLPYIWEGVHPAAGEGEIAWSEAWEVARPWFVDPDAGTFTMTAVHPEHWFQGEYDLIYRWDALPVIVDLKASLGAGDRSHLYVHQMRIYAWLWWACHDEAERIEDLRIWYLGTGTSKKVSAPSLDELRDMSGELRALHDKLFGEAREDGDTFDCAPAPLHYFEPGAIPATPATDADPFARCGVCPHAIVCPRTGKQAKLTTASHFSHQGRDWPIKAATDIVTRVTVEGEVMGLHGPTIKEDHVEFKFTLKMGPDQIQVANAWMSSPKRLSRAITNGARVRIEGGVPTEWKGVPKLELDRNSILRVIDADQKGADTVDLLEIETTGSVYGRVFCIRDTPWVKFRPFGGKAKLALSIADGTGTIDLMGAGFFVPDMARSIRPGDEIAILNCIFSEFRGRPQVKLHKFSRMVVGRPREEVE